MSLKGTIIVKKKKKGLSAGTLHVNNHALILFDVLKHLNIPGGGATSLMYIYLHRLQSKDVFCC